MARSRKFDQSAREQDEEVRRTRALNELIHSKLYRVWYGECTNLECQMLQALDTWRTGVVDVMFGGVICGEHAILRAGVNTPCQKCGSPVLMMPFMEKEGRPC